MRKARKIDHLSGLSPDEFFGEVAAGIPLLIENAFAYLNSANALARHAPGRSVGHLRSWHNLTTSYYNRKEWDSLIDLCKEALDCTPLQAHIWNDLGYAHLQLGRFEDAKEAYKQASLLRPPAFRRLTAFVRRGLSAVTARHDE